METKQPIIYKYKVGDQVHYTNSNGVYWGIKTIIGLDERNGPTYFISPTDTPWFSIAEKQLTFKKRGKKCLRPKEN